VHPEAACGGARVLGLQARGDEVPVARLLGLVGHEVERTLVVALRCEAAVADAAAVLQLALIRCLPDAALLHQANLLVDDVTLVVGVMAGDLV